MFDLIFMMEICPPTNQSYEEDSKACLKVGEIVGVAKHSSKQKRIFFILYSLFYLSLNLISNVRSSQFMSVILFSSVPRKDIS